MNPEEYEKIKVLVENAYNGGEAEMDALESACKSMGISTEQAEEIARGPKPAPETAVEQRRVKKGKSGDEDKSMKAIDLKAITNAYGVDLDEDDANGEYDTKDLQSYLNKRGVFAKIPGESAKEYLDRQRNAFESLGLNWDNKEDRLRLAKSIELLNLQNARNNLAEESQGGVTGFLGSVMLPRVYEQAKKDIKAGIESPLLDYVKAGALDTGEDFLMTVGSPVGGSVKAVGKIAGKAGAVGKNVIKEYQLASSAAGKGIKKLKNAPVALADNAAVPVIMEFADAAAYGDENPRGEFSGNDVGINTGVNLVAKNLLGRKIGQVARRAPVLREFLDDEVQAAAKEYAPKVFKNVEKPLSVMEGYELGTVPLAGNKGGKSEMVRTIPLVDYIYEDRKEELEKTEKQAELKAKREAEWDAGMNIPQSSKDRHWKEFKEWEKKKSNNNKGLLLSDYIYTMEE